MCSIDDFKAAQERRRDALCEEVWRVNDETARTLMDLSWDLLVREGVISQKVSLPTLQMYVLTI